MDCGSSVFLEKNVGFPCAAPIPGALPKLWAFYRSQVTGYARDTTGKVITAITMKGTAKMRNITGYRLSNEASVSSNVTTYATYLPHNMQLVIFDKTEFGRLSVDQLKEAQDLVIVYREKDPAGNFIMLGANSGMSFVSLTSIQNDENGGAFVMNFNAPNELYVPEILRSTTDTETYLNGLTLVPA